MSATGKNAVAAVADRWYHYCMSTALIPRKTLFGNPDRASVRLSRDGKQIAWLAPLDGVLNVWVAPRGRLEAARAVTHDDKRGIRMFVWTYTNNHVLYIQDKDGDENWRIYAVDLSNDTVTDLTPLDGVQARIQQISPEFPEEVLVGLNNRVPQLHDIHRLNFVTGEMSLVCENPQFVEILTDDEFAVRQAYAVTPDGGMTVFRKDGDEWKPVDTIPSEDSLTTYPAGFSKDLKTLYLSDSRGRDTSALYAQDFETLEKTLIAENDRADLSRIVIHPSEKTVQAVAFDYERRVWTVLDPDLESHLEVLRAVRDGVVDDGAVPYYLYDTTNKTPTYLFSSEDDLDKAPLVHMHPATIKTRDGLDMVIYYSLPGGTDSDGDGVPDRPVPMVLHPHGGPWARDHWGYSPIHQWLANRGYAVMTVNFRSSTGFGKSFTNAGNFEWGGKILEDQIDAVAWAIERGIADRDKIAVMGGSFGGYSTLAGLTMHPDVYACGVDIVGPSNLITLLESVPEYWKPMLDMLKSRVGDNETEEGKALLRKHSPLSYVDNIKKPLLIGQGANDPRVKQAESDQIVSAMQDKGIPVTYVLYSDEGHGFARPENRLSFFAVAEAFLAEHLGGRFEPVGDDFENSTIAIKAGRDQIDGLPD
jgi:dipeptidyl aminopeptidase/acylaminoacyl peptidase